MKYKNTVLYLASSFLLFSAIFYLPSAQAAPDLTLTASDIDFSNDSPVPDEVITITATIHNNGDAYNDELVTGYTTGGDGYYSVYNGSWEAQSFLCSNYEMIKSVSLYLLDKGVSDTAVVEIQTNSASNKPSGTLVSPAATKTIDAGSSISWFNVAFDEPIPLLANTAYWIVLKNTNVSSANGYGWEIDQAGTYPSGNEAWSTNQGSTWSTASGEDLYLNVYGCLLVKFYDGDPDIGGTLISTCCIINPIPATGSDIASSTWTYPGGSYDIYVKADPDNDITESDETNNKASKEIPLIPPNAITDLTALTYGEAQEIKLSWTAPGDDGTVGDNTSTAYYIVRYATFSCDTAGSTQTWWNHVNVSTYTQNWFVSPQGTLQEEIVGGLTSGLTYYFAIKTVDAATSVSDIDENSEIGGNDQAEAYASTDPPIPPCAISNLTALTGDSVGIIKLKWTAPGDDGQGGENCAGYEVRYSSNAQITTANYSDATVYSDASFWIPVNYGTEENRVVSGLSRGTTYWFAIKAYDNNSNYGSWSSEPYTSEQNKAAANDDYMYYVNSNAPDDIGAPGGDPDVLENCWKTIGQAFSDLKTNESNDLTGKGFFVIQIQNSADYDEGIELNNLTTTADDTLTIRAAQGERPTWKNDSSTVLFMTDAGKSSYGALKISIPYVTIQGINFTGTSADVEKAHGIYLAASSATIRNCIFHDLTNRQGDYNQNATAIFNYYCKGTTGHKIYNNTFYNVITCIKFDSKESLVLEVRNNIFCVNDCSVETEQAFLTAGDYVHGNPDSNYNIFQIASGNRLAYDWGWEGCDGDSSAHTYLTLANWQAAFTPNPDQNSLSGDPKFVTPGTDFHLQSTNGHWTDSGWVKDAETSPCIDAGAPYSSGTEYTYYENEPEDNGDRVNMGAYGNTEQASVSGELAPDAPAELTQYKSDGITEISAGDDTDEETVVFKSTVTDPTDDQVKIEVEVKACGVTFDGAETSTSSLVASGNVATTTNTFSEGSYHWRARTIDEYASSSTWVCFGTDPDDINEVDFRVNIPPAGITTLSASTSTLTGGITLEWESPGDDEWCGDLDTGSEYKIQYATYNINWDYNEAQITMVASGTSPHAVKSTTTYLTQETTYYFRIWTHDEVPNYSSISYGATCWCYIAPAAITTLTALAEDDGNVKLSWTAPGDDVLTGDITDGKFRIRWSTYNVSDWESDWDNGSWDDWANKYSLDIDTSCSPLSTHSETITGLTGGSTYYFRIWTGDELLNWSELSNGATTTVKIIYGVDITTVNINLTYYEAGGSTVVPFAVPVKSISNVVSNFAVLSATGTSGTPWQISDTPGIDKITIYCVINSTIPSISDFKDEDKLTNDYQTCTDSKFSIGYEDGVNVEAGGIRNTWYLIKFPLASNTTAQQSIIINFKAQEP